MKKDASRAPARETTPAAVMTRVSAETSRSKGSKRSWRGDRVSYLTWHRVYATELGRFCSRDPIGYDRTLGLYGYVADDPNGKLDPFGLEWTVDRSGSIQATADCCNDTVDVLARKIGLAAWNYASWLVPADGLPLPVTQYQKMGQRKFLIPNTVIAYWAGWTGWGNIGKIWVEWDPSVHYLKNRGFSVVEYHHVPGDRMRLRRLLRRSANSAALHGLYFWGHSLSPYPSKGLISDEGKDILLYYKTLNLRYKMALALVFACDSDSGKSALSSGSPGHIWYGHTGTLYPIGPMGLGPWHVSNHIWYGDQETK